MAALLQWLSGVSERELAVAAEAHAPLARQTVAAYSPAQLALARFALGPDALDDLRAMGEGDFKGVVDAALATQPAKGAILWRHEPWAIREMGEARRLLLGR